MQDNRWIINRAGLVNFWYYDEETFDFSQGRLLLRGSNGSGKSVTMQSFIPLLLDGNKSPERLDPFGSRSRKIEDYILGEDEKDESIGYLFMEFKKKQSQNTATIGMGFRARRGKPLKSWGFSITDGRQVGKDFFLYKQMGEKIPLTMKELENRIADGGQVVEGQKNYMKLVNDLIFGFDDLEEYGELVKLLVQLRSPKLSKGFKPTVIYEIMENSLQALSEDDLRPMSEAIENMDNIKSRLVELKESKGASDRIKQAFDRYNKFIIHDKAALFHNHRQQVKTVKSLKGKKAVEIDQATILLSALAEKINELEIILQTQLAKKRQLENHDSVKIREKIIESEKELGQLSSQRRDKDKQHDLKRQQERDWAEQINKLDQEIEAGQNDLLNHLLDMEGLAEVIAFDEHGFMADEIRKDLAESFDFTYIFSLLKKHQHSLNQAVKAFEEEKQISRDYEKLLMALDQVKKEWTEKEADLKQANRQLADIQDESLETLYQKNQTNQEYIISNEGLTKLSREIRQFGPDSNFFESSRLLRTEQKSLEDIKRKALYEQEALWSKINHEKTEKEVEIDHWKKMKDPEPFRSENIIKNREKLDEEGIPYIPLYKALDYVEGLDQATQSALEEAMTDMGLLDALIIPTASREKLTPERTSDKYIFPSPHYLAHTINQYLKVDDSLSDCLLGEVEEVLKSILIDANHHSHLDEKGNYRLGILRGRASHLEAPKFIGSSARKRYRVENQEKLEGELGRITNRLDAVEKVLEKIRQEIDILNQEFSEALAQEDLITAAEMVKQTDFHYQMCSEAVAKKSVEEKTLYQDLTKIKERVYQFTRRIALPLDLATFYEAQTVAETYLDELHSLHKEKMSLGHRLSDLRMAKSRYEEVLQEIDDLLYEMGQMTTRRATLDLTLKNLNEQLELTDYQAIKAELDQCLITLRDGPKEKEQAIKEVERERTKRAYRREELKKLEDDLLGLEKVEQIFKEAFAEEVNLGYVVKDQEGDLDQLAADLLEKKELKQDKEEITKRLFDHLNSNSQYLSDYAITSLYIFEDAANGDQDEAGKKASQVRKRLNITAKVTGKVVNFYELSDYLKDSLEETERLLKKSDRELFEEILVKNISKKIRARIFHSEKWVENMNQLMGKMDTSMGLSFSLRWTSKKAETEEQLDTRKLVSLLKTDGKLLREEDLKALSDHFRSKIALARRRLEEDDIDLTFHTIMKDVLDYRKWFEFKLFFRKTGQVSKELTNNAFFKFSGGEKAMAMYVPLFSAVNARYEAADKESARILSLDEAFAGVDEQNIRDMFRLLNDLDLSYVINSQILWGDYDTVDSLAIAELIRPDNTDFVTVLRYYWNGRVRKLVVDDAS